MAENKHNNALGNYDNAIAPANKDANLKDKFKNMVSAIGGDNITKLNKLESKLKTFNMDSLLGKLGGALAGLISSQSTTIALLKNDALKALENSATAFGMNIVEQFVKDIKSAMYIDDSAFLITIKGLYYAGGDLAYNDSYIRKTALSRDWNGTLKFCDTEYGINYNLQYPDLSRDLALCSKNSCWKNLKYIYSCMIINYNKELAEKNIKERLLNSMEKTDKNYNEVFEAVESLNRNIKTYRKLMVDNLKKLITYSYSYLTPGHLKGFFDEFGSILKPKYFGTTDDLYGKAYNFNTSDINIMMPFFKKHATTESDKYIQNQAQAQATELKQISSNLKSGSKLKTSSGDDPASIGRNKAMSSFKTFTSKVLDKQSDRSGILTKDALQYGSGKVFKDSRAKYNKNISGNANRVVKYKNRQSIGDHLEDALVDKDQYITTRNNNIKSIYILLTNVDIFGQDVMVNEKFYERCKYKTMTALNSALDKAKGLLPASGIIQGLLNISDALDASIYDYEQTVEKYLFDPKVNVSLDSMQFSTFQFDPNSSDLVLPTVDESIESKTGGALSNNLSASLKQISSATDGATSANYVGGDGSNTGTVKQIEKALDENIYVKKTIADTTRYLNNFPMIQKKNLIVKYLSWFYNTCIDVRNISGDLMKVKFTQLVYSIIGVENVKTPDELELKFTTTTNDALSDNLRIMISISELHLFSEYVNTKDVDVISRDTMIDTFNQAMYLLRYEMLMLSFIRGVFIYDSEYLSSFTKQLFRSSEEAIKEMVQYDAPFYKVYNFKDTITRYFKGYDYYGILGYDSVDNRVKNTNIVIGDFNVIGNTKIGLYFLGNSLTKTGVKYLNVLTLEIENTNQTTGNWSRVVNSGGGPIFVKDNKELWTAKPSSPKELQITNIIDYMNWELVYIPEYSLTILISTKNEGIKVYDKTSSKFINTIITTGSNYKYSITKSGMVFYSQISSSGIYFYNDKKFSQSAVTTGRFSSYYDYVEGIKKEETYTDDSEQEVTVITYDFNYHLLFASLDNLGIIDLFAVSSDNEDNDSPSLFDVPTSQLTTPILEGSCKIFSAPDDTACVLFTNTPDNYIEKEGSFSQARLYYKKVGNVYEFIPNLNNFDNPEVSTYYMFRESCTIKPELSAESSPSNPQFVKTDLIGLSEPSDAELLNSGLAFSAKTVKIKNNNPFETAIDNGLYIYNGVSNIKQTGASLLSNGKIEIKFVPSLNGEDYCIMDCKIDNTSDIFYKVAGISWVSVIDDDSLKKYGWTFKHVSNGKLIFINNYNNLGVASIVNSKLILSNINYGSWEFVEMPMKYLIYSINGANKGIKISNKNFLNFTDTPDTVKSNNDFGCHYYDIKNKRLFLGTLRTKTKFNANIINYDIDEFIYGLTTVNLHNLLTKYTQEIFEVLLEYIERRIKNSSAIYSKIKTNEEPKPLKDKTYYTKDGEEFSLCGEIESFEEGADYYTCLTPEEFEEMKEAGKITDDDVIKKEIHTLIDQSKVLKPNPNTTYYIKTPDSTPVPVTGIETWDQNEKYYVKEDGDGDGGEDGDGGDGGDVIEKEIYTLIDQSKVLKPDPNATYYIKPSGDIPVTGIETWDQSETYYVKGEINCDVLKSEMSKTLGSFVAVQKNSGFYTDITDIAKARQEFDIDDGDVVNGISLDMILNSSDDKASRNLLNYKARNRETIISSLDNEDEPNVDKTSTEWLKTHNFTSSAYLDSDDAIFDFE